MGTTLTKYFTGASGLPTAERVGTNGPLSYLASDGQGTVSEALDSGGNVTFAQLYTPYGAARYSSGSSPTTLGYTGQRADSATGLDYYHARYYDPVAGQFASADTVNDGLNRYGYVAGNPTTATDPTGHRLYLGGDDASASYTPPPPPPPGGGSGGDSGGPGSSGGCTSDANCSIGKTITCTPTSLQTDCADYVQAYSHDMGARQDALEAMYRRIAWLIGGGSIAGFIVDLAEIWLGGKSALANLITVVELLGDLAGGLTWLPIAHGGKSDPDFTNAVNVLNQIAAYARGIIAVARTWGQWAQAALDAGWIVASGLLKGLPGILERLLVAVAGNTVLDTISMLAHGAIAIGYMEYADYQKQMNMDIGAWCDQNPTAGCVPIPSNQVVTTNY